MSVPPPGSVPSAVPTLPPPPGPYRWAVALACSLAMFGNYYVFDGLYPVVPLLEQRFGFTGEQVGLLDTAYNVAALLTLVAGGVLIDRLGMAASALLFSVIGATGAVLIALLPALFPSAPWEGMMVGRFVLGVGSECFIVAVTTVVGRWFKGKEVALALAIQLLIARLGSLVADQSPGHFAPLFGSWQPPLLLAAGFGVAWLVFAGVYAGLERRAATRYAVERPSATDKLVLADLVRFDHAYWWVVGLCTAFYATIFPFRTFANLYFVEAHGVSADEAGNLKSVLPLISMIGMPIFGLVADRIGRRTLLMAVGAALLVPPFLFMAFTALPLQLSMGMLGLSFALVPAVLWPAVTFLVPSARLGSAYAMMTFCQQIGWAAMSWGLGKAKDMGGWAPVLGALATLACSGFVFAFLLWREERSPRAHGLEAPAVAS